MASFSDQAVTNLLVPAAAPTGATVNGKVLTLTFGEAMDEGSVPPARVFTVTTFYGGGPVPQECRDGRDGREECFTVPVTDVSVSGATVTLTLAEAIPSYASVSVLHLSLGTLSNENRLRTAAGRNAQQGFVVQPSVLTPETAPEYTDDPAPVITATALSSDPGPDNTYEQDDKIHVQVTFNRAVLVGGQPRIRIIMGEWDGGTVVPGVNRGARWAYYESGSRTTTLTFAYTVAAGDYTGDAAAQGIAVGGQTLQLNGGRIRAAQDLEPAQELEGWPGVLSNDWLPYNRAHKVDARADDTVWTATLDPKKFGAADKNSGSNYYIGCEYYGGRGAACWSEGVLEPETAFTHAGTRNSFHEVYNHRSSNGAWNLTMVLEREVPTNWDLHVGDEVFCVERGDISLSGRKVVWDFSGDLGWVEGTDVALKLTTRPAGAPWTCGGSGGHALPPDPLFQSAAVDGTALTLTFDQDLRAASTPAPGAFHVTVNNARRNVASGGVAVSGNTVTLTLASVVREGDTVKVRYTRPSANPLQGGERGPVKTFADQSVTNNTMDPTFSSATVDGTALTVTFDENLDAASVPAPGAFHVTVNNAPRNVASGGVAISGATVTLTLASAVEPGDTVKVRYTKPSSNPLHGVDRVPVETFADQAVTNNTTGPTFSSAAVDATALTVTFDRTLDTASVPAPGAFHVTVETDRRHVASGGVAVSGKTVTLTLASAVVSTDTVKVRYTKPSANPLRSVAGLAVATFADQAVTNNTRVALGELVSNVDVGLAGTAAFGSIAAGVAIGQAFSTGSRDGGYTLTDVQLGLTRDSAQSAVSYSVSIRSDSSGNPGATVDNGTLTNPASLPTSYELLRFRAPGSGIALAANTTYFVMVEVAAGSDTLKYVNTTTDAEDPNPASGWSIANGLRQRVSGSWRSSDEPALLALHDGFPDTSAGGAGGSSGQTIPPEEPGTDPHTQPGPTVTGVEVTSDPGSDDTYGLGDTIQVTLTFSDAVDVTGTPRLKIDMDPAEWGEKWAAYDSGSGTASLTFTHTVVEPNISTQGIAVLENTLELNGGDIELKDTDNDAELSHDGLAHDSNHKVDWQTAGEESGGGGGDDGGVGGLGGNDDEPSAPASVSGVAVSSSPQANATYALGETIQVTLTFSEAVDVTGTPRLKIDMDPAEWGEKWASYASGSGTTSLTFTHTVVEPNISTQGIAVLEDTLDLNGGTIQSDDTDADLSHTGLAHDSDHKVDWRPETPEVDQVEITSDPESNDTYGADEVITVSVTFDEAVDVDTSGGTPRLKIDMDPAEWGEKWASYASGSGTATLTFTHTVVEPNISTQGIAVLEDTLELNGGDIESKATDTDADLSHTGLAHDSDHKVDWQAEESEEEGAVGQGESEEDQSEPASVSGVNVSSSPQANATYALGETIQVTLTFDEAVDVTGEPRLKIDMDPAEWGEKWAAYQGGSGTATLTFTHTVVEPNISTQGIAVLENTLELNGGTIRSDGADAGLAHTGLAHNSNHKVDWRLPLASVTGVSVTSDPGTDDTYANGDVITITLTFSKAVEVTGAPRLKIDMDPAEWGEKWAAYHGGSGTTSLTFTHTVVEPNISTQGIAVLANTLELNGGTIHSDGLAAQLAHSGLAHDAKHKVDWQQSDDGGPGS